MNASDKAPSILLIVGGGIAAYKSLELIRLLRGADMEVRVVLTKAGAQFVTPLSLASLSGNKVYEDLFSLTDETEMGHIELSRQADAIVIAPATADLLAKAAHGLANDLASTLLLASDKAALAAPAMNWRMWTHPATQENGEVLRRRRHGIRRPRRGRHGLRRIRSGAHGRARADFCRTARQARARRPAGAGRAKSGDHRRADP